MLFQHWSLPISLAGRKPDQQGNPGTTVARLALLLARLRLFFWNTHTHHTNLDNYERVVESDVKDSAIVIAATLYQLVMRDQMVPRFAPADMPPPVARTSSSAQ